MNMHARGKKINQIPVSLRKCSRARLIQPPVGVDEERVKETVPLSSAVDASSEAAAGLRPSISST
jgi:hypothetical protein